jgi:hypothetical protein
MRFLLKAECPQHSGPRLRDARVELLRLLRNATLTRAESLAPISRHRDRRLFSKRRRIRDAYQEGSSAAGFEIFQAGAEQR